jgi:hypothetical protein
MNVPDEGYSRNVPDEGYSRNVPDEGYSRKAPCALNSIRFFIGGLTSIMPWENTRNFICIKVTGIKQDEL